MNILSVLSLCYASAKIALITQYHLSCSSQRQKEIDDALALNLDNPYIDKIVLLQDRLAPGLRHSKLVQVEWAHSRLSFSEALEYANRYLFSWTVLIANNDVSFDNSLRRLHRRQVARALNRYAAFFLSRLESDESVAIGSQCSKKYMGSHDAFILRSPVPSSLIEGMHSVHLGQVGADARFVWEARKAGLIVGNPCWDIRAWHHHASNHRSPALAENNLNGKTDAAHPVKLKDFLKEIF